MPPKKQTQKNASTDQSTQRVTRSRANQGAAATVTASSSTTTSISTKKASSRKNRQTTSSANETPIVANERDSDKELIKQALVDARAGRFPKVVLNFVDANYPYSAILNLFKLNKQLNFKKSEMKNHKVSVVCLFCKNTYHCKSGRFTNLNAHIDEHATKGNVECQEWLKRYNEFQGNKLKSNNTYCSHNNMLLVHHFMASNNALTQLKEKSFLKICEKAGIKVASRKTFIRRILPD